MIKSIKTVDALQQEPKSTEKLLELLSQDILNRMMAIARKRKDDNGETTQQ